MRPIRGRELIEIAMVSSAKIASVVGARPQFVKLAPVAQALDELGVIEHVVVHTGQHYDANMSETFFDELELPAPDQNLEVGSGTHADQTGKMLTGLEAFFDAERPDVVVSYGDTNSTLAATLAATKLHVPVAHIESGLRSFNREMPEEINRLVADHCSDRLYAPTPTSLQNLGNEGLSNRAILTGDVMFDAVLRNISIARAKSSVIDELRVSHGQFGLVTVHRPVNTGPGDLENLLGALETVVGSGLRLIFPVHPRTKAVINELQYRPPKGLSLIDPLPYLDNILMIEAAAVVITDSGGVQKEAAFLSTPCITLRQETEWTETIELGINQLANNDGAALALAVADLMAGDDVFDQEMKYKLESHYGTGNASAVIARDLIEWLQ